MERIRKLSSSLVRPFVNGAEEQKPTLQRSRSASVQPSTVHRPRRPRSHGGRPIHKRDISGPVLQVDSTTYVQWASDDDLLPPPTPEVRQLIESDRAGRERAVKPLWPSDAHAHATSRHHQVSAAQKTRQQGRTSHSRDYDAKPLPSLPLRRPPLATVPPKSDKEHAQGLSSGTREPLRVYNPPVHQSSSQDQLDAAAHRSASDPHFTLSQPRPVNVQPGYKPFLQRSLTSPSVSPVDREPHGDAAMPRSANAVMQGAKHVAEQTVYMPPKQRRIHEDAYGYSKSEEHLVYEPPTTQRFNPFLPVPAKAASAGSVESKQGRTSPKIRPQPGSRSPSEQGISHDMAMARALQPSPHSAPVHSVDRRQHSSRPSTPLRMCAYTAQDIHERAKDTHIKTGETKTRPQQPVGEDQRAKDNGKHERHIQGVDSRHKPDPHRVHRQNSNADASQSARPLVIRKKSSNAILPQSAPALSSASSFQRQHSSSSDASSHSSRKTDGTSRTVESRSAQALRVVESTRPAPSVGALSGPLNNAPTSRSHLRDAGSARTGSCESLRGVHGETSKTAVSSSRRNEEVSSATSQRRNAQPSAKKGSRPLYSSEAASSQTSFSSKLSAKKDGRSLYSSEAASSQASLSSTTRRRPQLSNIVVTSLLDFPQDVDEKSLDSPSVYSEHSVYRSPAPSKPPPFPLPDIDIQAILNSIRLPQERSSEYGLDVKCKPAKQRVTMTPSSRGSLVSCATEEVVIMPDKPHYANNPPAPRARHENYAAKSATNTGAYRYHEETRKEREKPDAQARPYVEYSYHRLDSRAIRSALRS